MHSDELLARRAAQGRLDAFEELLGRYRDRVYRLCLRWAGNRDDAEDWAQECFVRAWRQLHFYDPNLPFAPWMLRLSTNTCINLLKARSRHAERTEDIGEREWSDDDLGPFGHTLQRDEERRAQNALSLLPPQLKAALVLRVVEDLTLREVSEVLGVPLQTAATRVKRALELMRDVLEEEERGTRKTKSKRRSGWRGAMKKAVSPRTAGGDE